MTNKNSTYKRLGDYIREVDVRNKDLRCTNLLGLSIAKKFIPSIANMVGTDLRPYKIVKHNQFAYVPVTSRNGEKITVALYTGNEPAIISQAYVVFEIVGTCDTVETVCTPSLQCDQLLPEYLMMWFRRPEFDRYARFHSHGSAREVFDWEEMCDVMLPVPSLEEQRSIVSRYKAIETRIANNKQTIAKLEEAAQALYRKMFVDDVDVENLPEGWRMGCLGEVAEYYNKKISTSSLSNETYISTENLLKDKKGITTIDSVPEGRCNEFKKNMILLSNIRPYFKKLWKATFDGGCSADVLCFVSKNGIPSDFLYYTMAEDSFFDHVVSGSNGVKMPRGDKDWTIKYPIVIPNSTWLNEFQKKVKNLVSYSKEIQLENEKLTEMLSMMMA